MSDRPEPPPGYRWEWVDDRDDWRTATPEERATRPCRNSPHAKCTNPVDIALNRGMTRNGVRSDVWWFYCLEHSYGRRIHDGRVQHRRAVPIEAST